MKKEKINYKLVNFLLLSITIFVLYNLRDLLGIILNRLMSVITPFALAFAIAYVLYPFVKKLQDHKVNKKLSIFIVIGLLFGFIVLLIALIIPMMIEQLSALFNASLKLIQDISSKYSIDLKFIQENISDRKSILNNFGKSISDFSISIINQSINIVTILIISFITTIYFLSGMDKIRIKVKNYLKNKNKKTYNYIKTLDYQMSQYFIGLQKYMLIQFVEYTLLFFLIGHPYYLILGVLCSVTTIIPYFGGIFANIIAAITAFFVSKTVFILTLIIAFICPNIDGYIISPKVYGKTNNVPALLTIFAAFAGGKLYGILGIVLALPITILLLSTYRFYKDDIINALDGIKKQSV